MLISSISVRAYIENDNTLCERVSGNQRLESDIDFLLCYLTEDLSRRLGLYSFWESDEYIVSCCRPLKIKQAKMKSKLKMLIDFWARLITLAMLD